MPHVFADSTVFQRTEKGQREVVSPSEQLSPSARRLLLWVNGYTTFGVLVQMMRGESYLVEELSELIDAGHVALATLVKASDARPVTRLTASWTSTPDAARAAAEA